MTTPLAKDSRGSVRWHVGNVLVVYPVVVAILGLGLAVVPQQQGFLALVQILLPHLVLASVILVPVAAVLRHRVLAAGLLAVALVGVLRFGSEWVSAPATSGQAADLTVLSWNLEVGARAPEDAVAALQATNADVVGLQELTPEAAAAIEADPLVAGRFPHRILDPESSVLGMGLLSRFPITAHELFEDPVGIEARVELADGTTVAVVNAHPLPGTITAGPLGLPVAFDASRRDAALERLRVRLDHLASAEAPLVVLGDYNVAPTEPAYRRLAEGLKDSHRERGQGPGWTWRPSRLEGLGLGLLRIDYILTSRAIHVTATGLDCTRAGDHCLVTAELDLP